VSKIRADVAELLRAGYGDTTIARRLGVTVSTVKKARSALRLPAARSGNKVAGSVEDLYWRYAQLLDDGHASWSGHRTSKGTPCMRWGGRTGHLYSAYRVAFRIHHGREPEGFAIPGCGMPACVAGPHITDRLMREQQARADALYARIFGGTA